jgi:hypothetical protein
MQLEKLMSRQRKKIGREDGYLGYLSSYLSLIRVAIFGNK